MKKTATPANAAARPNGGAQTCEHCGGRIFYSVSDRAWIHDSTWNKTCPKGL